MTVFRDLIVGSGIFKSDFYLSQKYRNVVFLNIFDYELINKIQFQNLIWWFQDERFIKSDKFKVFVKLIKNINIDIYFPNHLNPIINNQHQTLHPVKTSKYFNFHDVYVANNSCIGAMELLRIYCKSNLIQILGVSLNYSWQSDNRKFIHASIQQNKHLDLHVKNKQIHNLLDLVNLYEKNLISCNFEKHSLLTKIF